MKVYYKLDDKFIGKMHCDREGKTILTDKLSQKKLKELYIKGNKFVSIVQNGEK